MKYAKGDKVIITCNRNGHGLKKGQIVTIQSVISPTSGIPDSGYYIVDGNWSVDDKELKSATKSKKDNKMKNVTQAVYKTAKTLLKANNTVTTLEVKTKLRKDYPTYHWIQNTKGSVKGVSEIMNDFATNGKFTYKDNGTYRTYSFPKSKTSTKVTTKTTKATKTTKSTTHNVRTISRLKAHDLMSNNGGRFFTATFTKKDGTERVMSCTYLKDQTGSVLGYIKVKDTNLCKKTPGNCVRNVNLQTLSKLSIGGKNYNIR